MTESFGLGSWRYGRGGWRGQNLVSIRAKKGEEKDTKKPKRGVKSSLLLFFFPLKKRNSSDRVPDVRQGKRASMNQT